MRDGVDTWRTAAEARPSGTLKALPFHAHRVPPRILVIGGLREPGLWDTFARNLGVHAANAGASLAFPVSSGFGRAMLEGFEKTLGDDAAPRLRIHADDEPPSVLKERVTEPLDARFGGPLELQMLREADVVLIAGNGSHLRDTYKAAVRRGIPVVPLPIERATSEDLWEEHVRHAKRPFPNAELRNAFFAMRRPDPRSGKMAEAVADLLVGLATAPELPGGPRVLVFAAPGVTESGEGDNALNVVARALRAHAPGATIDVAPPAMWTSPGRALFDRAKHADLVVVMLRGESGAGLYVLGYARGSETPTLALAPRGEVSGLNPDSLGLQLWEADRELAVYLDKRLPKLLAMRKPAKVEVKVPKKGAKKRRPRRRKPRGEGDAPSTSEGPESSGPKAASDAPSPKDPQTPDGPSE